MLKKIYFSLFSILLILISIFVITPTFDALLHQLFPFWSHKSLILEPLLVILLIPVPFIIGFFLLGNLVFKKYIDESSQSSKGIKLLITFSPLWFFPVVFGIVYIIFLCWTYYFK